MRSRLLHGNTRQQHLYSERVGPALQSLPHDCPVAKRLIRRAKPSKHMRGTITTAPLSICECMNLRVAPSARAANSLLLPPFSAASRAVCFDVGSVDHLHLCGSSIPSKFVEQVFPNAAASPAHEAVIDGRMWAILGRAIAPTATGLEHVNDSSDDAPIVLALNATHIRRQVPLDPIRSSFSQKRLLRMTPVPFQKRIRIVSSQQRN